MSFEKNIFVFITSILMVVVLLFYATMVISYQNEALDGIISLKDDGSFVVFGKNYKLDPRITEALNKYLYLCEKVNEDLFPDFITSPIKKAAVSLWKTADDSLNCIFTLFTEMAYGNM